MARHPLMITNASAAVVAKAETTIVNNLPTALGKVRIPVNGKVMTAAQAAALVQSHLDAASRVASLRAQLTAAIQAEDALRETVKAAVICIRNGVAAAFGDRSSEYASLGFEPRKPAQQSAQTMAEAVEKRRATRAARHTMGKRQRAKIFGQVPATAEPASAPAVENTAPAASSTSAAGAVAAMPPPVASIPADAPTSTQATGHSVVSTPPWRTQVR